MIQPREITGASVCGTSQIRVMSWLEWVQSPSTYVFLSIKHPVQEVHLPAEAALALFNRLKGTPMWQSKPTLLMRQEH